MRMLVSDMAGRASIELKSMELGVDLGGDRELIGRVVERVKEMESRGFTFEAADASFELLLRTQVLGKRPSFFTILDWQTTVHQDDSGKVTSKATVQISAKGETISANGVGNGPVNAFDNALRSGLKQLYPELEVLELTDYKVRILEGRLGTGAVTRVLVETSDGKGEWNTYDVVCVDGVIKLSVNGKFVNGISKSSIKKGYLCLESEGSEIHFRNIRIMELPPGITSPEQIAPIVE